MIRHRTFVLAVLMHPASGPVHVVTQSVAQGLRVTALDMEQGTFDDQVSLLLMPCRASFHGGESPIARVHLDIKGGETVRRTEFIKTEFRDRVATVRSSQQILRVIAPRKPADRRGHRSWTGSTTIF